MLEAYITKKISLEFQTEDMFEILNRKILKTAREGETKIILEKDKDKELYHFLVKDDKASENREVLHNLGYIVRKNVNSIEIYWGAATVFLKGYDVGF